VRGGDNLPEYAAQHRNRAYPNVDDGVQPPWTPRAPSG